MHRCYLALPDTKILYISYSFPPINAAASFRAMKLTNHLHEHGIHAVVLTKNVDPEVHIHRTTDLSLLGEINKKTKVLRARYFSPTVFHVPFKILGLVKKIIRRHPFSSAGTSIRVAGELPRDPFIPDHYIEWIPLAFRKILASKVTRDVDLIYASGPPLSVHLLGYLTKAFLRKPLILEYRDVLVDDPYNKAYSLKEKYNRLIERMFLRASDAVVSVSRPIIDSLIQKYKMTPLAKKGFEIPSAFDPADFTAISEAQHDRDEFTITLTTTLYGARRPDLLFEIISMLKKEGFLEGIRFSLDIYGYNEAKRFEEQLKRLNIQDIVQFKGFIPHKECISKMKGSTFNLDLGEQDFDYPTVPFHFWEYIGTGKRILHLGYSDHYKARFVRDQDLGIVLPIENPEMIKDILVNLIKDFKSRKLQAANLPRVIGKHSWDSRVRLLSRIIHSIVDLGHDPEQKL
nr:glycosyltransferase [Candidatus Sigynarchaeota archaeon]